MHMPNTLELSLCEAQLRRETSFVLVLCSKIDFDFNGANSKQRSSSSSTEKVAEGIAKEWQMTLCQALPMAWQCLE